jgi:hypothetical protein
MDFGADPACDLMAGQKIDFEAGGSTTKVALRKLIHRNSSAANLKFLSGQPQVRHRNFKFKAALQNNSLLELL